MTAWTLRDIDNRDDSGAPYEITDKPKRLVPYLDQAVRRDLTASADEGSLDELIGAFKTSDLAAAVRRGHEFGIYVSVAR